MLAEYEPRYEALRASLERIASKLPPAGYVSEEQARLTLDPLPEFAREGVSNTAFLMESQLSSPVREVPISLGYHSDFNVALYWTRSDRCTLSGRDRAKAYLYETLDAGLETVYLVVHRVLGLEGSEPITAENFDKRALIAEGFLIDLRTEEIIASWRLRAGPHSYRYRWDPDKPYAPYYSTAQAALSEHLVELTGGEFDFGLP